MKILMFCHLGQIQEYAEYIKAFKRIRKVEAVLLTMGQAESELGHRVGAFDAVKEILPTESDIDCTDSEESTASRSLKNLEERVGFNFINKDILVDRFFRGQSQLNMDSSLVPLVWTGRRTRQFMYFLYQRLDKEKADFSADIMFVETSFAPTRMAWRLVQDKGIPAGGFMAVRFWPDRLYFELGIGYDWQEARAAYANLKVNTLSGAELVQVRDRLHNVRVAKAKPPYLQTDHAKGAPGFLKRLGSVRLLAGHGGWLGARSRTFSTSPQVLPPQ